MAKKEAKSKEVKLVIPSTVFEVNGKKFKFRRPAFSAKIDGAIVRYTAAEALKDAEVLAHLVSIKSSVIEPITEQIPAGKKGDGK